MKKLFTAILLVAMIASIASVAAFAADYQPVTVSADNITVEEGATEAVVTVKVANPNALGLSTVLATVKVEGTQVTAVKGLLVGQNQPNDLPADEARLLWADTATGTHDAEFAFAEFTVAIPEGAKVGDVLTVEVIVSDDEDNYQSFDNDADLGDTVGYGATAVNGSITIVEKAVDPEPQPQPQPGPVDGSDKPAESVSDKPEESKKAAEGGKKAPQTGDVAIIVVAAMVVALGTAIVVKKVNVK